MSCCVTVCACPSLALCVFSQFIFVPCHCVCVYMCSIVGTLLMTDRPFLFYLFSFCTMCIFILFSSVKVFWDCAGLWWCMHYSLHSVQLLLFSVCLLQPFQIEPLFGGDSRVSTTEVLAIDMIILPSPLYMCGTMPTSYIYTHTYLTTQNNDNDNDIHYSSIHLVGWFGHLLTCSTKNNYSLNQTKPFPLTLFYIHSSDNY